MMEYIFYIIIGIISGFLGGFLGVGGGLVVVPALLFIFHLLGFPLEHAMQVAIGTSLAAMVFTAASSAWAHYKLKGVNIDLFKALSPGIVLGAFLGALIADYLPSKQLQSIFGLFSIIIGSWFIIPAKSNTISQTSLRPRFIYMILIGIGIGAISSIMGIGGGIMTVPLLVAFMTPIHNAIATSAATGFIIAFVGALSFSFFGMGNSSFHGSVGYVYLPAFIIIGVSSMFAAPVGAKFAYETPSIALKRIFGSYLLMLGFIMLINVVSSQ